MAVDETSEHPPVPERFVPTDAIGEATEAEHYVRYWWAAELVRGRRVLDAGCGTAYGTALLASAGAAEVVGVDRAEAVIEAARADAPAGVEFQVADLADLPFEDGSFGAVVCFEVIEHLEDASVALAELRRVLAPDGVLVVSSPNRDVYVPGNPHHTHEFTPDELREALGTHFQNVRLYRQHDWVTSAVLDDETFATSGLEPLDLRFAKVTAEQPGRENYTLAVATDGDLPEGPLAAVATGDMEVRHWVDLFAEQQEVLHRQQKFIDDARIDHREVGELRLQLEETERQVARVPALEVENHGLRRELDAARAEIEQLAPAAERAGELDVELQHLRRLLDEMKASPSWRLTAPLRRVKQLLR